MSRHQTRSASPGTRKATRKRTARRGYVRPRQRAAAQPAAVAPFAASLSALRLEPKPGIEVVLTLQGKRLESEPRKMLTDLIDSYMAAENAWNGIRELPVELDMNTIDVSDTPKAIGFVVKRFADRFCTDDIDFIVEEGGEGWYFALFRRCPYTIGWRMLEACNLLHTCRKISAACLEIAYSFLRLLDEKAKIECWYDQSMEWDFEYLADRAADEWEDDEGNIGDFAADLLAYKKGEPHQAARKIKAARKLTPDQVISRLTRIKKDHQVIDKMILMCALLREPYTVPYFSNYECDDEFNADEETWMYLSDAFTLIWSYSDSLGIIRRERLDAEWNSGSYPSGAFARFDVLPKQKDWSLDEFNFSVSWPKRFSELLMDLNDACEEPINKRQANALVNILV